MSEKKLFLLDAMALIYRANYALIRNPRITSKGRNTNAQFGFTTTLLDLINKERPTHLAVVFDTEVATERHTDFVDYKANRQEAPEDLSAAIPDIKKLIRAFNLPCLEKDGFEADDVIGTLALEAADLGYTVYMVTPDKDYGQIVRDNIFIYKPSYQGGGVEILGPQEVCAKWNISSVSQVVDMLGLMGDAVDNIPGIAGVGEKTAAKLLAEYGTLDNVLENSERIKGAMGQKIMAGKENAILSKKLATIITDVPINFHEEDFRVKDWNREALKEIFNELEFKAVGKRILGEDHIGIAAGPATVPTDLFGNPIRQGATNGTAVSSVVERPAAVVQEAPPEELKTIEQVPHEYQLIVSEQEMQSLVREMLQQKEIAFDTETTGIDAHQAELIGMSFSWTKNKAYYVSLTGDEAQVRDHLRLFRPAFDCEDILWIGQNLKYDMTMLWRYGFALKGKLYDTMLANYVIEPEGKRNMDILSTKYLQYLPISIETLIGKGRNQKSMRDVDVELVKEYAAEDADVTLQLKHAFDPLLDKQEVRNILEEVENPLVPEEYCRLTS